MSKLDRINVRLDPEMRERLLKVCALTGLDEPTALRACIEAFVAHVEETGEIRLPLAIVPKSSATGSGKKREDPVCSPAPASARGSDAPTALGPRSDSARYSFNEEQGEEEGKSPAPKLASTQYPSAREKARAAAKPKNKPSKL